MGLFNSFSINFYYSGEGLEFLSNGLISFKWDLFSDVTCKLRFFLYFQSESLSQLLLVWLTIERLIAFYRPFCVRSFATKQNGLKTLCGLVLFSIIIAAPTLYHFNLQVHPNSLKAMVCKGVYKSTVDVIISILFMCILCEFLPEITILVCTFLLGYKIHKLPNIRNRIQVRVVFHSSSSNSDRQRVPSSNSTRAQIVGSILHNEISTNIRNITQGELKLAKSIYILAFLELLMTLIAILIWIVLAFLEFIGCSKELVSQIFSAGILLNDLMIIIRLWNIYIYYFTMPVFKHEANRLLCCASTPANM